MQCRRKTNRIENTSNQLHRVAIHIREIDDQGGMKESDEKTNNNRRKNKEIVEKGGGNNEDRKDGSYKG